MKFIWGTAKDTVVDSAFKVRVKVFVDEQGFSVDGELDNIDKIAHHIVGFNEENEAVCAARLFSSHNSTEYHAGRIAVSKELRGQGVGRVLIEQIILKAKELNGTKVVLDAQYDKAEFYEKCGFIRTGEEKMDEGYPHVCMEMIL